MNLKALAADAAAEIKKLLAAGETNFEHLLEDFHLKAKALEVKEAPKAEAEVQAVANDVEKDVQKAATDVEHVLATETAPEPTQAPVEPAAAPEGASPK